MLHLHGAMQLARQRHPGFIQRLQEAVLDHGIPAAALGGVEGGIRGFDQVAGALSGQIHDVLTNTRGDILTIGAVLAVYFASNGVEALRVALNRAYAVIEPRRWYWLRLESIGYTLVAAFTSLAMAFLIVLGPLIIEAARRYIPFFVESNESLLNIARYGITHPVIQDTEHELWRQYAVRAWPTIVFLAPDGTVQSRRLSNAQIAYRGSGEGADAARASWGTRALYKYWPF